MQVIQLVNPMDERFALVEELFRELYQYQRERGLMLPLRTNGEKHWVNTVKSTLNRFSALFILEDKGHVTGFVHGLLKFTPDYLGNERTGWLSHQYIIPSSRRKKGGKMLYNALETWFREHGALSIEVQSVSGNLEGQKFYSSLGFNEELMQYRKPLK